MYVHKEVIFGGEVIPLLIINRQSPIIYDSASFFSLPCAMRAYTLLEVLIVLVLMTTVMLFIGMALDIHVRQMTINSTEVEEAQLARTILDKIARDIRSVVVPVRVEHLEVDVSALTAIMGLPGAGDLLEDFNVEEFDEYAEDREFEDMMLFGTVPGIYGGLGWIQIDTARLPRGELFGARQIRRGTSLAADRLSASKTVRYYLGRDTGMVSIDDPLYQPERLMGSIGRSLEPGALQYGLFRRQLDRQATQYAIQMGMEFEHEQYDEPLAPEVEWIEFYYFDPEAGLLGATGDWVDAWDMDERQMLPLAVQIVIAIRRPNLGRNLFSLGAQEAPEPVIYSLVVPIPVCVDIVPFYGEEWYDEYFQ